VYPHDALADPLLFGRGHPQGQLPFDHPSSMQAQGKSRQDRLFASANPPFLFGHG
jgi:hypothetical protein